MCPNLEFLTFLTSASSAWNPTLLFWIFCTEKSWYLEEHSFYFQIFNFTPFFISVDTLATAESWNPILGILVQNSSLHQNSGLHQIWQYLKWKEMHTWLAWYQMENSREKCNLNTTEHWFDRWKGLKKGNGHLMMTTLTMIVELW